MTTMATSDTHRLLGAAPAAQAPRLSLDQLLGLVEGAGLTGRGGAGFPTAIKVRAVAAGRGRPVLVGNAMEGEPLSRKDAVLLTRVPHLVVEGLGVVGRSIGARRLVLGLGPGVHPAAAEAAAHGTGVEVAPLAGGFVAGQESALVNQLAGRPAVPADSLVRLTTRGLDGRPTLVLNAETLAQVALLARYGVAWFRRVGTREDPGTSLFSISGAVARPGVVEAPRGTPLAEVLGPAVPEDPVAVLVGGYHGAWVPGWALETPLTGSALREHGASVGAGVLHVLGPGSCPIRVAADIAAYLAGESAQQCGPCVNGLPRMAEGLQRLARRVPDPGLPGEIDRMRLLVTGRGACAHPDGTARMVASTMRVFASHVDRHLAGRCGLEA